MLLHRRQIRPFLVAALFGIIALPSSSASAGSIISVNPNQDVDGLVQSSPAGTTFKFSAGVYRLAQVHPKDGDTFLGSGSSTVFTGATLLDSFSRSGSYYEAPYTTSKGQLNGFCVAASPMCRYPEDLFFDNKPLVRVVSLPQVGSGKWFLDYTHQVIYFTDNPAGHTVEISTARSAFSGSASQVTIQALTVEKYAVPAQMGAIGDQTPGFSWNVTGCTVRWNHGAGIKVMSNSKVVNNNVYSNGQKGIGVLGADILVQGNEISFNNYAGFDPNWEAGGTKFSQTTNLIVRANNVHDNTGAGLWTDIENVNTLYDGNIVHDNSGGGIQHEISYSAVIQNNTVWGNGRFQSVWLWGSQILIQNSQGVEVKNNKVMVASTFGNGIGIVNQQRGLDSKGNPYLATNDYVHDNDITYLGTHGGSGVAVDYNPDAVYTNSVRFDYNHYHMFQAGTWQWQWLGSQTFEGFQSYGMEAHGTVQTESMQQPILVHAGGGSYTDPISKQVWSADSGYSAGRTWGTNLGIGNTSNPGLYRTERVNSGPLSYTFAVNNGSYIVVLRFAEIYFRTPGSRVMNVYINGGEIQHGLDLVAAAGGAFRAYDLQVPVTVTNGSIQIDLQATVNNPKISAIDILPSF